MGAYVHSVRPLKSRTGGSWLAPLPVPPVGSFCGTRWRTRVEPDPDRHRSTLDRGGGRHAPLRCWGLLTSFACERGAGNDVWPALST